MIHNRHSNGISTGRNEIQEKKILGKTRLTNEHIGDGMGSQFSCQDPGSRKKNSPNLKFSKFSKYKNS